MEFKTIFVNPCVCAEQPVHVADAGPGLPTLCLANGGDPGQPDHPHHPPHPEARHAGTPGGKNKEIMLIQCTWSMQPPKRYMCWTQTYNTVKYNVNRFHTVGLFPACFILPPTLTVTFAPNVSLYSVCLDLTISLSICVAQPHCQAVYHPHPGYAVQSVYYAGHQQAGRGVRGHHPSSGQAQPSESPPNSVFLTLFCPLSIFLHSPTFSHSLPPSFALSVSEPLSPPITTVILFTLSVLCQVVVVLQQVFTLIQTILSKWLSDSEVVEVSNVIYMYMRMLQHLNGSLCLSEYVLYIVIMFFISLESEVNIAPFHDCLTSEAVVKRSDIQIGFQTRFALSHSMSSPVGSVWGV